MIIKGLVTEVEVATDDVPEETCQAIVEQLEREGKLPYRPTAIGKMHVEIKPAEWVIEIDGESFMCWYFSDVLKVRRL